MPTSAKVVFLDPSKVNVSKNLNMSYRYDIIDRCLTSKIISFVIGVAYLSGGIFTLKNNKFLQEYIIVPLGKTIFLLDIHVLISLQLHLNLDIPRKKRNVAIP